MNRFKRTTLYIIGIAGAAIIVGIFVNILSIFISRGISTNFNVSLLSILATLAGGLIAGAVSLTIYYNQISKERKLRQQHRLLESDEQQQKDKFISLSKLELELEKQKTNLEKQQQTLLWQMAAAEEIKDDPKLAIIIAYQGLESEIQKLISKLYQPDMLDDASKQKLITSYDFDILAKCINPDDARDIMQMHDLRDRIVHGEVKPGEITEDKVKDYVQKTVYIARDIFQAEQTEEI